MSTARDVTLRAASARTTSWSTSGKSSEISVEPCLSLPTSATDGGRICTTASASASTASAEASTRAPAARYSSSLQNDAAPAPASTETSIFLAASRLTDSGTMATRRSPAPPSFRTAILMWAAHSSRGQPPGQGASVGGGWASVSAGAGAGVSAGAYAGADASAGADAGAGAYAGAKLLLSS